MQGMLHYFVGLIQYSIDINIMCLNSIQVYFFLDTFDRLSTLCSI